MSRIKFGFVFLTIAVFMGYLLNIRGGRFVFQFAVGMLGLGAFIAACFVEAIEAIKKK